MPNLFHQFDRIEQALSAVLAGQTDIRNRLARIERNQMSEADALHSLEAAEQQAENDEAVEEATLANLVNEVAALKAQLAGTAPDNTAEIQSITDKITALDAKINAAHAAAAGSETPPPVE